jgi:quinolinate synthase
MSQSPLSNVGVGTLTPGFKLHVSASAGVAGDILVVSTGISNMFQVLGTGEVIAAKFTGNATDNTKVLKVGDTMTGALNMNNVAVNLTGASGIVIGQSSVTASAFFGDGSHLSGLTATDNTKVLKAGDTMTGALNMSNVAVNLTGAAGNVVGQASMTASAFFGDASHLSNVTASQVPAAGVQPGSLGASVIASSIAVNAINNANQLSPSLVIRDANLSNNVDLLNGAQTLTGAKTFSSVITANGGVTLGVSQALSLSGASGNITSASSITASAFFGDASHLSNVTASQVPAAGVQPGSLGASVIASSIAVNAINNADQLAASLVIPDTNLSNNVDLLNGAQTLTGAKTFSTVITANGGVTLGVNQALSLSGASGNITSASSITASAFFGDASHLSNVTASQVPAAGVQPGSLGASVIASSIAVNAISNADQLAASLVIPDANLSNNVDLLNGAQTLTGAKTFSSVITANGGVTLGANQGLNLSGTSGNITSASSVTASAFFGDGSHLSGLGTGLGGSGTTGDLAIWTGANTLGNANVTQGNDGTGFRIGGQSNTNNETFNSNHTLLGGSFNTITGDINSAIVGGKSNQILHGGNNANQSNFIGGGENNVADGDTGGGGGKAAIIGGLGNHVNANTGGANAVIAGNGNLASGNSAVVVGGTNNIAAGNNAVAAGQQAHANHQGSFVWADNSGGVYATTADNQFKVRANNIILDTALLDINGTAQFGFGAIKSTFSVAGSLILAPNASLLMSGSSGNITSASSITASAFFGDASQLSNVTASQVPAAGVQPGSLGASVIASSIAINAINNADQLAASLVIPDANLSNNVDLLNGAQTLTGAKTFSSVITANGGVTLGANQGLNLSGASGNITSASSVTASAFFGDGSHLSNVTGTDNTKVLKAGDTMTGALNMSNVAVNLTGAAGNVVGQASMTASAFFGDGSHLTGIAGGGSGGIPTIQAFNSNGTFIIPAGVTKIMVDVWGGGGNGGTANSGFTSAGGGGGAGGYGKQAFTVIPGDSYIVTVGGAGQSSSFGVLISATGGATGNNGNTGGPGPAAAVGGTSTAIINITGGSGGGGGDFDGGPGGSAGAGGGGGGGGMGTSGQGATGAPGSIPGGGGGGGAARGFTNAVGGAGAAGRVIVMY